VTGFTLQGESVKGNSAWYLSENDNFFWAGNSSFPQPRPEPGRTQLDVETTVPSESPASETAVAPPAIPITFPLGVAEIDGFFANASCPPLELAKGSRDAVGIIQDLLAGHGFAKLPSILSPAYGAFGDATQAALSEFQNSCGLPSDAFLTTDTMKHLVGIAAKDPRATRAHFSLVLGIPFTGLHRVLALTAQMEGAGRFAALNLNTDSAGLSFGLIQWAQRPGRLIDVVSVFWNTDPAEFVQIFGNGDADVPSTIANMSWTRPHWARTRARSSWDTPSPRSLAWRTAPTGCALSSLRLRFSSFAPANRSGLRKQETVSSSGALPIASGAEGARRKALSEIRGTWLRAVPSNSPLDISQAIPMCRALRKDAARRATVRPRCANSAHRDQCCHPAAQTCPKPRTAGGGRGSCNHSRYCGISGVRAIR